VKQEDLLKLFHKYGFQSLKKEPFLYVNNDTVGITYTLRTSFYGNLNRIYIPKDARACESFLAKYCWYKKYNSKNLVDAKLTNYQSKFSSIKYLDGDVELNKTDLLNFKEKEEIISVEMSNKDKAYLKKIKRTFFILVSVIEEKIKIQNITYQNLIALTNEYIEKQNEWNRKFSKIKKYNFEPLEKVSDVVPESNYEETLMDWKEQVKILNDKESIEDYIKELVGFLKSLELDDGLLKNKFQLIKLPLEINHLKEKIQVLETYSPKKGLFGKKASIDTILNEMDQKNESQSIVSLEHYIENEKKRIDEKYQMIPDLDVRTIGDFFIEFDNLKIDEPIFEIDLPIEKEAKFSYEEIMKSLEMSFQKREKQEQDLLIAYEYILKNVMTGNEQTRKSNIEDFMNTLMNPNNIMARIKYFKDVSFDNLDSFTNSVQNIIEKAKMIPTDNLLGNINIFWKGNEDHDRILKASSKRFLAPTQNVGENKINYIGKLNKGVELLFVPFELKKDFLSGDALILQSNRPFFLIDLEKNEWKENENDIIKVKNYEIQKKEYKNYVITDLVHEVESIYKEVWIERK